MSRESCESQHLRRIQTITTNLTIQAIITTRFTIQAITTYGCHQVTGLAVLAGYIPDAWVYRRSSRSFLCNSWSPQATLSLSLPSSIHTCNTCKYCNLSLSTSVLLFPPSCSDILWPGLPPSSASTLLNHHLLKLSPLPPGF